MKLSLDRVLLPLSPPAGMDLAMIGAHQATARKTREPCTPSIKVSREGDYWRVCDGRHRFLGWHAGGRTEIEAEICQEPAHEHN